MRKTIYIPGDSSARAAGSDEVALEIRKEAEKRGLNVDIVRNGSRGMYWLEPLLEVSTPEGRFSYGPVSPASAGSLFDAGFLDGGGHPLSLGRTEDIPYLKDQERLLFKRAGLTDPLSIEDYRRHGGYKGLQRAINLTPRDIIEEVKASGHRGRGGGAFPTGLKWETALKTPSDARFVVCNADEGDCGSFSDRMIMEGDPFALIEGMTIAALAVGARKGYVYLRSEYPYTKDIFGKALKTAYDNGCLGRNILGSNKDFDISLIMGGGSYICGEETALLESMENRRGMVRPRPPVPAVSGLFSRPTVLNNVMTFVAVASIFENGAEFYRRYGTQGSTGTLPIQLSGNIKRPGLIEKAFGADLKEIVYGFGGGTASGRPVKAIKAGGPLGAYLPASVLEKGVKLTYEDLIANGGILGHGSIIVFDDSIDISQMALGTLKFGAYESCGKCTPCRIGSVRAMEIVEGIVAGNDVENGLVLLKDLLSTMSNLSLCGLGGLLPLPISSALRHFPEDFGLKKGSFDWDYYAKDR